MADQQQIAISVEENQRIDKILALSFPEISRETLKQLIKKGQIKIDGAVILTPALKFKAGQEIQVSIQNISDEKKEVIPLPKPDIIFEDRHLMVINKPANIAVHEGAGNHPFTLVDILKNYADETKITLANGDSERPGIIHRLDKDTSGLMLAMKSDEAYQKLQPYFSESLTRIYLTIVHGRPQNVIRLKDYLSRHPKNRIKFWRSGKKEGKLATLIARNLKNNDNYSLMLVKLGTGRTHQIRVQFSLAGYPVMGDKLYNPHKTSAKRQALHACYLSLSHPIDSQQFSWFSSPSEDFIEGAKNLGLLSKNPQELTEEIKAIHSAAQQLSLLKADNF